MSLALQRWWGSKCTRLVYAAAYALLFVMSVSNTSFAQSAGSVGSRQSSGDSSVAFITLDKLQRQPTLTGTTCIDIPPEAQIVERATGLALERYAQLQALRERGVKEIASSKTGFKELSIGADTFVVTPDLLLFKKDAKSAGYEAFVMQVTPAALKQLLAPLKVTEALITYQQAKNDRESGVVCIAGGTITTTLDLLVFAAPAQGRDELGSASATRTDLATVNIIVPPLGNNQSSAPTSMSTASVDMSRSTSTSTASDSSPASNSSSSSGGNPDSSSTGSESSDSAISSESSDSDSSHSTSSRSVSGIFPPPPPYSPPGAVPPPAGGSTCPCTNGNSTTCTLGQLLRFVCSNVQTIAGITTCTFTMERCPTNPETSSATRSSQGSEGSGGTSSRSTGGSSSAQVSSQPVSSTATSISTSSVTSSTGVSSSAATSSSQSSEIVSSKVASSSSTSSDTSVSSSSSAGSLSSRGSQSSTSSSSQPQLSSSSATSSWRSQNSSNPVTSSVSSRASQSSTPASSTSSTTSSRSTTSSSSYSSSSVSSTSSSVSSSSSSSSSSVRSSSSYSSVWSWGSQGSGGSADSSSSAAIVCDEPYQNKKGSEGGCLFSEACCKDESNEFKCLPIGMAPETPTNGNTRPNCLGCKKDYQNKIGAEGRCDDGQACCRISMHGDQFRCKPIGEGGDFEGNEAPTCKPGCRKELQNKRGLEGMCKEDEACCRYDTPPSPDVPPPYTPGGGYPSPSNPSQSNPSPSSTGDTKPYPDNGGGSDSEGLYKCFPLGTAPNAPGNSAPYCRYDSSCESFNQNLLGPPAGCRPGEACCRTSDYEEIFECVDKGTAPPYLGNEAPNCQRATCTKELQNTPNEDGEYCCATSCDPSKLEWREKNQGYYCPPDSQQGQEGNGNKIDACIEPCKKESSENGNVPSTEGETCDFETGSCNVCKEEEEKCPDCNKPNMTTDPYTGKCACESGDSLTCLTEGKLWNEAECSCSEIPWHANLEGEGAFSYDNYRRRYYSPGLFSRSDGNNPASFGSSGDTTFSDDETERRKHGFVFIPCGISEARESQPPFRCLPLQPTPCPDGRVVGIAGTCQSSCADQSGQDRQASRDLCKCSASNCCTPPLFWDPISSTCGCEAQKTRVLSRPVCPLESFSRISLDRQKCWCTTEAGREWEMPSCPVGQFDTKTCSCIGVISSLEVLNSENVYKQFSIHSCSHECFGNNYLAEKACGESGGSFNESTCMCSGRSRPAPEVPVGEAPAGSPASPPVAPPSESPSAETPPAQVPGGMSIAVVSSSGTVKVRNKFFENSRATITLNPEATLSTVVGNTGLHLQVAISGQVCESLTLPVSPSTGTKQSSYSLSGRFPAVSMGRSALKPATISITVWHSNQAIHEASFGVRWRSVTARASRKPRALTAKEIVSMCSSFRQFRAN